MEGWGSFYPGPEVLFVCPTMPQNQFIRVLSIVTVPAIERVPQEGIAGNLVPAAQGRRDEDAPCVNFADGAG
jgi:hypothetical protein